MISEEYLFKDKNVRIYDRKIITTEKRRGALISIGFLGKKKLKGKVARMFVKQISDDSFIIYLKLINSHE
jgi:hypothetical protein